MNLDPRAGASQSNFFADSDLNLLNRLSQSQNQQSLHHEAQASYKREASNALLTVHDPEWNQKPPTATHLISGNSQGHIGDLPLPSENLTTKFDNNIETDRSSMYRGGNQSGQMIKHAGPVPFLAMEPPGELLREQAASHAVGTPRSMPPGHHLRQPNGGLTPLSPAGPKPKWPGRVFRGTTQATGMASGILHPAQFTRAAFQFPARTLPMSVLTINDFAPRPKTPISSGPNHRQTSVPNVPTTYGPVNPLPTSSASVVRTEKKLKISRDPPRAYTEDDFRGIRDGGKRMTTKSRGEWDAETKANHYPFFLAYHGRPKYQPSQEKAETRNDL